MIRIVESHFKLVMRLGFCTAMLLCLFPKSIDRVDSRGIASWPIAISVDQSSLGLMALTDLRAQLHGDSGFEEEQEILAHWGQVTLNAGLDSEQLVEDLLHNPAEQKQIKAPIEEGDPHQLTGMVISQSQRKTGLVIAQHRPTLKNNKIESLNLRNSYGEWEPLDIRKQKILAMASPESLRQPSVTDRAQKLVEEALKQKREQQIRRVLSSQTGGKIIVSKPNPSPSSVGIRGTDPPPSKKRDLQVRRDRSSPAPTQWKEHHKRPLLVSGQIRFSKGLAYTGEHILSITRVYRGKVRESGKVWLRDAKYEIQIKQAKGYLIAEMHDHSGLPVAYQEFDLSQLTEVPKNDYRVPDFDLTLRPVQQGAIVKVISGYSYEGKTMEVDDAVVTLEPFGSELEKGDSGQHVERSLEPGSDIVVRVAAKDHWPTLTRVTSGTVALVRLFHQSMMKALIDIVSVTEMERKQNQFKGIIWGVITKKGRPVSGAKVEILGDTGPLSYMNQFYLPDVGMQETSKNGMFAAIGAEEALHSVRVTFGGVEYPAQVVKVRAGHVSFIEINFDDLESVHLKIVDEFNQTNEVPVSIRSLGSDTVVENVYSGLDIESQKFPLSYHFLEADAGLNYELIRVEEPLSQHFIRFPLVQRNWINGIKAQQKLNELPESGTVVGWVKDEGFDILFNDGSHQESMRILYFNEIGQIVEKQNSPAGFIIFNAPNGQHLLTIVPHSRKTVMTKVITIDSEFVSVIYK